MEVLQAFTNNDDIDEYLSADSSVEKDDISSAVYDDDDELAAGLYFSLPDIILDMDFSHHLTEPLFPPMFDHDVLRYYSLDPPSISGLLLIPKYMTEKLQFEYVSLRQSQSNEIPDFVLLEDLKLEILQSCNGLLLCFSQKSESFYICNPATKPLEKLPIFPVVGSKPALNVAFDPNTYPDYKVISVQKIDPKGSFHQISIYSSETRLWTVSGKPFDAPSDIDFSEGVFSKGAIHWMKRTPTGLYFNISTELLKEMPKPPDTEGHSLVSCEYFGVSQGHLHYGISSPALPHLDVFEMKVDYTGWFLKTRIDLQALAMNFPVIARRSNNPNPLFGRYEADILALVQHHDDDDDDFEVILSIPGEVISYDNIKKSATKLCDLRIRAEDRAVWYRIYSSYQVL
ncbi:hypothetical protein RND81_08G132200 [Saponaria officinalis]|uniref:F-box associated beta-propeller type 1 domain-containing protein n=1 Tax=Saponaria officinalis TaxID=3572 RepID=A0AAW1J753_SAPOF